MKRDLHEPYVTAKLGYLASTGKRPCNYMFQPPAGVPWENAAYDRVECKIHDVRPLSSGFSLQLNGFALLAAPSAQTWFEDERQIQNIYYRELEEHALKLTGGTRAVVFDHLVRRRDATRPTASFGRDSGGTRPSALGRVHNDYTETSGPKRCQAVLPETAPDTPFLILNFWRPVGYPVMDTPLALCDARSFPSQDWVEGDLIYPTRTGEIYLARYSDAHRWFYYPSMTPGEMLVFKTYDSRLDQPARMTPHSAFDDPTAPADALPRQSIEARCLVLLA
ncbi:CmcJ/NvfI family oxidoreductase [Noviherbaspirillum saxi]|uniref:Methyltransferase n=1 Tax=Noviherbaspirillum saxi TaxID=2320863 RepID=A0A3A3FIQ9_9BURK|nr:CmcJ/NvfI family oxidoreductase [Noviherbaspirillum saxi]RJF95157.1 methyltransferase [Noviherbaspirillum saxi]